MTDLYKVNAHPTKEFFVFMLTKDIELSRAINDLVDNCVDGAKRVRQSGQISSAKNFWVRINLKPDHFLIEDNCGGIDLELARSYAFKFGRDPKAPKVKHSIGQFGVGMKRALFKIGKNFSIVSTTLKSSFSLDVDVDEWSSDHNNWDFRFKSFDEKQFSFDKIGTKIKVTDLYKGISVQASQQVFIKNLREELARAHQNSEIDITLNGTPVTFVAAELLSSKSVQPAHESLKIGKVSVEIYAGLADEKNPAKEAGWNIFCNGRLILDADKTFRTGWGDRDDIGLPMFHPQYNRFRGYVFFDSDDAKSLPWNTTKSDVDMDSQLYQGIRQKMISIAKPVVTFMNELKSEKSKSKNSVSDIEVELKKASPAALSQLPKRKTSFKAPQATSQIQEEDDYDSVEISYWVTQDKFEAVKRSLKAKSTKAVGEKTFDYYYSMECD